MGLNTSSNKVMDITADTLHLLSIEFKVTLEEINNEVWEQVYAIINHLYHNCKLDGDNRIERK